MQHDWAALIERASRDSRIVPGDVIGAGSIAGGSIPEAIRLGRPARYLEPGDRVEVTIEGLGALSSTLAPLELDPSGYRFLHHPSESPQKRTIMKLTERYNVVDIDTHIIEPADLWTARMSKKKWGDLIPQTRVSESSGVQRWWMGDLRLPAAGAVAHAGWKDFPPGFPPTLEQADPATWQAEARLRKMDEFGIYAAVLYPNLLGFQAESFMKASDPQFGIECVRAYNDFLVDFCSVDPERLIPVMSLPFWNLEESVREIARSAKNGHRGVIFGGDFTSVNLPHLGDPHWDPIMAAAQDHNLSINFHIGFAEQTTEENRAFQAAVKDDKAVFVKGSVMMFMGNAQNIADVILTGLCERFPRLKFVSVESGASWLPFLVDGLDWQWKGAGCAKEYPKRLLPSESFRRQVYRLLLVRIRHAAGCAEAVSGQHHVRDRLPASDQPLAGTGIARAPAG